MNSKPIDMFAIIFNGRSGSAYVMDSLLKSPQIQWRLEPFGRIKTASLHEEFLERFINKDRRDHIKVIAIKINIRQVASHDSFRKFLTENNLKFISLIRRNEVRSAV